jgi:hypothetical protein
MVVTGYLIQAITAEGFLRTVAYVHIGVGIVFALGFLVHLLEVRLTSTNGDKTGASRERH